MTSNTLANSFQNEPLGSGIVFQYAYYATMTISGAVFYIYLVHAFPEEVVGSAAILLAILNLFPAIFSLGLQFGWQHFISYELGHGNMESIGAILSSSIRIGMLLSIFAAVSLLLLARPITFVFFHSYSWLNLVYLLIPDIPLSLMAMFFNNIMLGLQRFRLGGIIGLIYSVLIYGPTIVALEYTRSVYAIPIGWGIGYLVGFILYYIVIKRTSPYFRKGTFDTRSVLTYSIPLYLTSILTIGATYIDRLTVAFLKNLSTIGVYNLALLIFGGVAILSTPVGGIIFSKLSEFYGKNDSEMIREGVRLSTNASSIIYVPASLGLAAITIPVIRLLGGGEYVSGALPLTIILVVGAIFVVTQPLSAALQGTRRTTVFIVSTSLALASNFAFSFALIPSFDLIGAAIGFQSTFVVRFIVIYYYARKANVVKIDRRFLSLLWLASSIMALAVLLIEFLTGFRILWLPVYIVVGIASFMLMMHAGSVLGEDDRKLFSSLVPPRLGFIRRIILFL